MSGLSMEGLASRACPPRLLNGLAAVERLLHLSPGPTTPPVPAPVSPNTAGPGHRQCQRQLPLLKGVRLWLFAFIAYL
jgi:hypothetical protein